MKDKAHVNGVLTKANGTEFGVASFTRSKVLRGATVPIASKKYKNRRKTTMDEAPMVYKPMEEIVANIADTVDIITIIKPIYNYKASE